MKERGTPHYLKIAQDICGKILTGEYPEGHLLKGRSVLGAEYSVSPETVRKALNILEKEKIVSSKRGVGVFIESSMRAQQFATRWQSSTQVKHKYQDLLGLLKQKEDLDKKILNAIDDMKDSFMYQTTEAVKFSEIQVPYDSWIINKTIGETYFYNYTEATIVAVLGETGTTVQSPGATYVIKPGDTIIFVGKDNLTFDRVMSFLTYGALTQESEQQ